MITFDLNTGIRELLEADPEVMKSADLSLSMLKSQRKILNLKQQIQ